MPTDDERREVARRLREHRGAMLFNGGDIEYFMGVPASDFCPSKADESYNRLADLIEPTCDRDALLEEVKELEKCAWYFGLDFDEDEPLRDRLEEASEAFAGSARRIREALEVES